MATSSSSTIYYISVPPMYGINIVAVCVWGGYLNIAVDEYRPVADDSAWGYNGVDQPGLSTL